jgi:hypothetical protein
MVRRREHLSAYLRICVSERQQNRKKIKKNQERIIRHQLKKNVPAGSNAYLRLSGIPHDALSELDYLELQHILAIFSNF